MIIWSLSGLRTSLYMNKYLYYYCGDFLICSWYICVLVPDTRRSIGDVPFNVIGGMRARQALGALNRLGCPMLPFTVYIVIGVKILYEEMSLSGNNTNYELLERIYLLIYQSN